MKRNNKLTLLTIATLLTMSILLVEGCTKNGEKAQDNPTLLLYLAQGNTTTPDIIEQTCLGAYALANSCVAGSQFFNAGVGCAKEKLKSKETYDALKACVLAGVADPIQPCNLTQFKYAMAQQAVATGAAFNKCTKAYVFPAGGTATVDLTGSLVY